MQKVSHPSVTGNKHYMYKLKVPLLSCNLEAALVVMSFDACLQIVHQNVNYAMQFKGAQHIPLFHQSADISNNNLHQRTFNIIKVSW